MNREEAKELLPIIQAFAEGKEVQIKGSGDNWMTCTNPADVSFAASSPRYRIKPEPEVIYVNQLSGFCGGQARAYSTVLEANKAAPLGGGSDYVYIAKKFIEAGE